MLEYLYIENYALIERLSLDFSPGMNILSGETGAGKSILVGALGLLLGTTTGVSVIRSGKEQMVVCGTFRLPNHAEHDALKWLGANNIETDDGRVIIKRVLKANGKSATSVQGLPVSRQQLSELTSSLIDMHGQHEHQSLFNIQYHRRYIDAFGDCRELQQTVQQEFYQLNEQRTELKALQNSGKERERDAELLRFAIKEIRELDPQADEDHDLEQERQRLLQYEKLFSYVDTACNDLSHSTRGALTTFYSSMNALKNAASIDSGQGEMADRLESLYYEAEDVFSQLSSYRDSLSFDPARLEFIEERLADLTGIKKKYGPDLKSVHNYLKQAGPKLKQLEHSDDYLHELGQKIKILEKKLMDTAFRLSRKRKQAAISLETKVQTSLKNLGMPKASFKISISQKLSTRQVPVCGPNGLDRVEFLLSANSGEQLKSLKDIASGGEISRVMLAIKNALAENDDIPVLVFDEIDSGIGGEVGRALGEHLRNISNHKQILCITHLASIAAYADTHVQVSKSELEGRTITNAREIQGSERVTEIARMLSGYSDTPVSLQHAQHLLNKAAKG